MDFSGLLKRHDVDANGNNARNRTSSGGPRGNDMGSNCSIASSRSVCRPIQLSDVQDEIEKTIQMYKSMQEALEAGTDSSDVSNTNKYRGTISLGLASKMEIDELLHMLQPQTNRLYELRRSEGESASKTTTASDQKMETGVLPNASPVQCTDSNQRKDTETDANCNLMQDVAETFKPKQSGMIVATVTPASNSSNATSRSQVAVEPKRHSSCGSNRNKNNLNTTIDRTGIHILAHAHGLTSAYAASHVDEGLALDSQGLKDLVSLELQYAELELEEGISTGKTLNPNKGDESCNSDVPTQTKSSKENRKHKQRDKHNRVHSRGKQHRHQSTSSSKRDPRGSPEVSVSASNAALASAATDDEKYFLDDGEYQIGNRQAQMQTPASLRPRLHTTSNITSLHSPKATTSEFGGAISSKQRPSTQPQKQGHGYEQQMNLNLADMDSVNLPCIHPGQSKKGQLGDGSNAAIQSGGKVSQSKKSKSKSKSTNKSCSNVSSGSGVNINLPNIRPNNSDEANAVCI